MRQVCAFSLFCVLMPALAFSQEVPRGEIFLGYSYLSADTNGLTTTRESIPYGFNTSFVANINPWIGAETNGAVYYKKIVGIDVYDYSLLFGPRVHYKWAFVHALFGMDDVAARIDGIRANQASAAAGLGGGVVFKIYRHLSLEGSGDYAFSHHNILGGPGVTQNNFRVSAGVVFTFGSAGRVAGGTTQSTGTRSRQAIPAARNPGMSIPDLGVTAVLGRTEGAELVDETPNGLAALAGLRVGDVITSVDDIPVKTPSELASELARRPAGASVKLGFLIRGQWQSEKTVVLNAR